MDEQELIRKAAAGDSAAFDQLMRQHENRIYAIALRMCGNPDDAMDCVQEAMLRIYRALSGFKAQSTFSTWVYRITMNACLDELRRRRAKPSTSLDVMLETGWSPQDESDSPEKHVQRTETRKAIDKAIAQLPSDMRAAIVLRDVQGFSYEEIAQVLRANVGTIKSRISRGRGKLREMLMEHAELFEKDYTL